MFLKFLNNNYSDFMLISYFPRQKKGLQQTVNLDINIIKQE
jgi:hypothetical protein